MLLLQETDGKLYTSNVAESSFSGKNKKSRVTPTLGAQFRAPDLSDISCTNNMFEDKEFCVLGDCESMKKNDIEKKIYEYGGQVVQNPGK